jgi:hypothetical protein
VKDLVEKQICRNEKQLLKQINEDRKIIMCYNFNVTEETVNLIKEKKIKLIALERPVKKRGKRKED